MKKKIIDTTLRDGEQAPGIVFSLKQRKRIAEMLVESGVDEIEAGSPAMGEQDVEFLRWCANLELPVSSWCRANDADIDAARRTNLPGIHISLPVSDRLLGIFGKNREWVERMLLEYCSSCFADFDTVNIGFMDASRTEPAYLEYLAGLAGQAGYDRVRIADTAGVFYPSDVIELFSRLSALDVEFEFHPHNDLGMATANGLSALEAGADAVSATLLGIGERAGNARIEEIAFARRLRGAENVPELAKLRELCQFISRITGRPLSPDKAVIGKNVFSHEAGIHVAATLNDPLAFQPARPEDLGLGDTRITAGRHSGTLSIQHILSTRALIIDRGTVAEMLPFVRERAEEYGRELTPKELELIYYEYINSAEPRYRGAVQAV